MRSLRLNLASEPFRRDRPMLVASAILGVLLSGLLGLLVHIAMTSREGLRDTREAIARVESQLNALDREQAKIEAALRLPGNAEVLERSVLLNALLQRKAVSWTKIFSDLEEVMPHDVRLISIRPEIDAQNQVQLQMVVGAQAGEPVLRMLMALETSPAFGATSLHSWLPPSQSEPLFRYRVSVRYAQKL